MSTSHPFPAGAGTPAKIFVVEDDSAVCDLIARTLISYGFECVRFYTGESLLKRIRVEKPDFCIVDLGLPDMDGIEVVRQLSKELDCGILILTGRGHTADRVMGLELGADDYMVKPFEERELVARVRSILRRRRAPGTPSHADRPRWLRTPAGHGRNPGTQVLCGTPAPDIDTGKAHGRPRLVATRSQH
jgi:two-component system, OmpR family, response regulator